MRNGRISTKLSSQWPAFRKRSTRSEAETASAPRFPPNLLPPRLSISCRPRPRRGRYLSSIGSGCWRYKNKVQTCLSGDLSRDHASGVRNSDQKATSTEGGPAPLNYDDNYLATAVVATIQASPSLHFHPEGHAFVFRSFWHPRLLINKPEFG